MQHAITKFYKLKLLITIIGYIVSNSILGLSWKAYFFQNNLHRGDDLFQIIGLGFFLMISTYVLFAILQVKIKKIEWLISIALPFLMYICNTFLMLFVFNSVNIIGFVALQTSMSCGVAVIFWRNS